MRDSIVANYVLLGDKDKALQWLEKMYEERDGMLIWLKSNPIYDSLRTDPRFQELMNKVGLPQ